MSNSPPPMMERFWNAVLLLLATVIALCVLLSMLERIWGWLLLLAVVGLLAAAGFLWLRRRRDRW